jgi:hypothetical protein
MKVTHTVERWLLVSADAIAHFVKHAIVAPVTALADSVTFRERHSHVIMVLKSLSSRVG